jgi:hypothetical protein
MSNDRTERTAVIKSMLSESEFASQTMRIIIGKILRSEREKNFR